jgi:hypothetical protein
MAFYPVQETPSISQAKAANIRFVCGLLIDAWL